MYRNAAGRDERLCRISARTKVPKYTRALRARKSKWRMRKGMRRIRTSERSPP